MAIMACCLAADSVSAQDIPSAVRERVERQCLPTQHRQGADAYRQCVSDEVARLGEATPSAINELGINEQFAVQSICRGTADVNCVTEQIDALAAVPSFSLRPLSNDEQLILTDACLRSTVNQGAAAYRLCVNDQLQQISTLPQPALGELGLLERNALEKQCGSNNADLQSYRRCLVDNTGVLRGPLAEIDTGDEVAGDLNQNIGSNTQTFDTQDKDTADAADESAADIQELGETDIPQVETEAGTQAATEADPLAEAELEPVRVESTEEPASLPDIEPEPANGFDLAGRFREGQARLTETLRGLDNVGKAVLSTAVLMPMLLLGLWVLLRSRNEEDDEYIDERYPSRFEQEDPSEFDDLSLDDPIAEEPAAEPMASAHRDFDRDFDMDSGPATTISRSPLKRERTEPEPVAEQQIDFELDDNVTRLAPKPELNLTEHRSRAPAFAWQSAFGEWLSNRPAETRLQSTIELLIYWIAYGDDRYDEQTRHAVLTEQLPDAHDLIKRWVLQSDAYALADAISWMQSFSTREQRSQTLDLLMTLLVTDGAMTPVQNTLLRFLGDAFGLGEAELDLQYSRAFGEPMPALPRVDKPSWWAQQDLVRMDRWDAKGLLQRPDEEQFRIRLGLSLKGKLDLQDINDAYRRAARRCQPARFSALGQRERALVKRQLSKLDEARTGLLGVNA